MASTARPRSRHRARDLVIALTSLAVLGIAVAYILMPTGVRTGVSVQDTGPIRLAAFVTSTASARPVTVTVKNACQSSSSEVVYGTITAKQGVTLAQTTIAFEQLSASGAAIRACGRIVVSGSGTFRTSIGLVPSRYELTVTTKIDRHGVSQVRKVHLFAGHAYEVAVTARKSGVFTFLPVSGY